MFITLEGIEGSGKSTQIKNIESFFNQKGQKILLLREPGGTAFGEKLREAILQSQSPLHPMAECHLFLASRAQLLHEKILPFLQDPKAVVIVDRYLDSTLAYQGVARGLGIETVLDLHKNAPLNIMPDRTYYLDISLETSLQRQNKRGNLKDYFESEKGEFTAKLIEGYRTVAGRFPERILTINAEKSEEEVGQILLADLQRLHS